MSTFQDAIAGQVQRELEDRVRAHALRILPEIAAKTLNGMRLSESDLKGLADQVDFVNNQRARS